MKSVLKATIASFLLMSGTACDNAPQSKDGEGQSVSYQATGIITKSLPDIAAAIRQKEITSAKLVNLYLKRIERLNHQGPELQAVISLNPNAVQEAKALDDMLAAGQVKGPLHGVPILVKDNIETKHMPTTAGAYALRHNDTGRDSPLIAGLKAQGAIILGKTNLSQWANFRSEDSMSGWSALGGQVKNPHVLDRNPCGSSSGSGSAAAASLAAGTVGTETNGSIICPSNAAGIVGYKPTVGLVSQEYIIPISHTQDTAGPMTKTVRGAAMMMNAMASGSEKVDYTLALQSDALKGVRVGVLRYATGSYQPIRNQFDKSLKALEAAGAILVDITERPKQPEGFSGRMGYDLLKYEFKAGLNAYLAFTDPQKVIPRTLEDLIAFNEKHADKELTLFDQSIFTGSQKMGDLTEPEYIKAKALLQKANQTMGIDALMTQHNVAVLVAPSGPLVPRRDPVNGDVWPRFPGAGSMAAQAGYPHVTVPMGGFRHVPLGMSFIASANQDAQLLGYAYAFEQQTKARMTPAYLPSVATAADVVKMLKPLQ